jgi:hypothetical protein
MFSESIDFFFKDMKAERGLLENRAMGGRRGRG